MTSSKYSYPPLEGMIPGQPAHDHESEEQRSKLSKIIGRLIELGFSQSEVTETAFAYNRNQPKPLTDSDVLDMCKLGCGERELQEPTTSS